MERLAEARLGGLGESGAGCFAPASRGNDSAGGLSRRAAGGFCRSCDDDQCNMFAGVTVPVRSWLYPEVGR